MTDLIRSSYQICKHTLTDNGCVDITHIPVQHDFLSLMAFFEIRGRLPQRNDLRLRRQTGYRRLGELLQHRADPLIS